MDPIRIKVSDFTGEDCILGEDGERIYEIAHSALLRGEQVVLDFEGVRTFASPCLNVALGQLLADISSEALNDCLTMENVLPQGARTIQQVIENAKSFYANPELHNAIFSKGDEEDL